MTKRLQGTPIITVPDPISFVAEVGRREGTDPDRAVLDDYDQWYRETFQRTVRYPPYPPNHQVGGFYYDDYECTLQTCAQRAAGVPERDFRSQHAMSAAAESFDWRMVLQFESDDDLYLGADGGYLYAGVHKDDLVRGSLTRHWVIETVGG